MTSTHARPRAAAAAVIALLLAVLVPAGPAVAADAQAEARFVALVNAERANRGLPSLQVAGDLRDVARRHSARMAQQGRLYHNPNLGSEVRGYRSVGENVGYGTSADQVHAAFMGSSGHRSNILSGAFTQIGVGVEWRDGTLWVTEVFRQPDGSQAPPPPPPAPAPAPAAKPAPKRAPAAAPAPAPEPEVAPTPDPLPEPSTRLRVNFARVEAQDARVPVTRLVNQDVTQPD